MSNLTTSHWRLIKFTSIKWINTQPYAWKNETTFYTLLIYLIHKLSTCAQRDEFYHRLLRSRVKIMVFHDTCPLGSTYILFTYYMMIHAVTIDVSLAGYCSKFCSKYVPRQTQGLLIPVTFKNATRQNLALLRIYLVGIV